MENPPKEVKLNYLRQADAAIKHGATIQQVCTSIGVDENTFNNWKKEYSNEITIVENNAVETRERFTRRFWLFEIWDDYREVFKAFIAHTLIFGLLLTILTISHVVINYLNYPADRKNLFDTIHFYGYVVILMIFVISFVIKVFASELRGVKR